MNPAQPTRTAVYRTVSTVAGVGEWSPPLCQSDGQLGSQEKTKRARLARYDNKPCLAIPSHLRCLVLHVPQNCPFSSSLAVVTEGFYVRSEHHLRLHEMSRGPFGRPHSAGISSAPPIQRCSFTQD